MQMKDDVKGESEQKQIHFPVLCVWCGATIRTDPEGDLRRMCLICHARMLNNYFRNVREKQLREGR